MTLWHDNRANRAPLVSTIVIRIMIAALFVIFVISGLFKASIGLIIGVAVLAVLLMVWSRSFEKAIYIDRTAFLSKSAFQRGACRIFGREETRICRTSVIS